MKKKDEGKTVRIVLLVVCYLNLALSIANCFINSAFVRGLVWGVNLTILTVAITMIKTMSYNMKAELKDYREWKTKLGYREDFDFLNRWQLKTKVKGYLVSTVDLGINHSWLEEGEPLYYETMIFNDKEENKFEYYQERYSTKKEAKKGHKEAISYVKEKLKEDK